MYNKILIDVGLSKYESLFHKLITIFNLMGLVYGACGGINASAAEEFDQAFGFAAIATFCGLALIFINRNFKLAMLATILSMVIPALALLIYNKGVGVAAFILVPAITVILFATMSFKYATLISSSHLIGMIAVVWGSRLLSPEAYRQEYLLNFDNFHLSVTAGLIFAVVISAGCVSIFQSLQVTTTKKLQDNIKQQEQLGKQLSLSLREKSSMLDLLKQVQQIGKIYGYTYYPKKDLFLLPDIKNDSFQSTSLNEFNERYKKLSGTDSQVVGLIKKALENKKGFDEEFYSIGTDGKKRYIHSKGKIEIENGNVRRIYGLIRDITETKNLNEQLIKKANIDDLTGLLNRRHFDELFERFYRQSKSEDKRAVYVFIDLDRFKIINDTSGHQAGDQTLVEISNILKNSVRETDVVGRLGGDEFGVLLDNCDYENGLEIAESIRAEVENFRFYWNNKPHHVEASIGIVAIDPSLGEPTEIKALADAACYRAKNNGRNRVEMVIGNEESFRNESSEKNWVNKIDNALDNNLFCLYFQDIAIASTSPKKISKREILLRMLDEDTGSIISPSEFLNIAERYNKSTKIDRWVINELIRTLEENREQTADVEYWVNLSGHSISDPQFSYYLTEKIKTSQLETGLINFEITETSAIKNIDAATHMMKTMQELGCKFALDDFGTGHASFGYLRMLPVSAVKIDGMFIRNITEDKINQIFVKSIIEIAHAFGMTVTAEFVENDDIIEMLENMETDFLQGYGISKPKPFIDIVNQSNKQSA